ncbi:hypothetical protein BGZ88_007791 [Linnemannia elongata]|nr:hypothetical protein BGZ88_007791 [Linnemannia elongata]
MSTTPTTHLPPHLSEPTTQPALASTVTTHQSKPKSLPPEILHTIFTYLNHGTLRRSVNRVCKQWRLISNHYIHRTATWIPVDPKNKKSKNNKNKNKGSKDARAEEAKFHEMLLDQLEGGKVDTFECWVLATRWHSNKKLYFWGYPELWDDFITAMHARLAVQTRKSNEKSEDNVEGGRGGSGSRCLFESIRTLNIYSNMVVPETLVVDLKPCFGFLETVKIELMKLISTTINIFTILDNGPRLKSVEIIALRNSLVEITQGDTTPASTTTTTTTTTTTEATAAAVPDQAIAAIEQTNRPTHSTYYPLQQLILQGPCIDTFMTAERIIKTCPDLRVLKSIRIKTSTLYHNNQTQQEPSIIQEASKCLAAMARVHCPHLIWYQSDLQYINHDLPNETRLIELAQMFPEMRALSMMAYEDSGPIFTPLHPPYQPVLQTPFLPDLINIFLNRITVLEVGAH